MNRVGLVFLLYGASMGQLEAQARIAPLYVESFRQGSTQVTEKSLEAKLSPQNPEYKDRIKDAHGLDRYELLIVPRGPEGDDNITSWQVKLRDLHHGIYENILVPSQQPSTDARDNPGWLDPAKFSRAPIEAKRIIKVDSFFVVLEVKQYHFTPLDSPYLDSMTVDVKLTNTDPRQAASK